MQKKYSEKNNTKAFWMISLITILIYMIISLTSPTTLYRDPWMYRHKIASEHISDNGKIITYGEAEKKYILNPSGLGAVTEMIRYFGSSIFITIVSMVSGITILSVINQSIYLLFFGAIITYALYRKIFQDDMLALFLTINYLFFSYYPVYFKITPHGGPLSSLITIFIMYIIARELYNYDNKQSTYKSTIIAGVLVMTSYIFIYTTEKIFLLQSLFECLIFVSAYFILKMKSLRFRQNTALISTILFAGIVAILLISQIIKGLLPAIKFAMQPIIQHIQSGELMPTFLTQAAEGYVLDTDIAYKIMRYFIPAIFLVMVSILNIGAISHIITNKKITSAYLISQFIFNIAIAISFIFSYTFLSVRSLDNILFIIVLFNMYAISIKKRTNYKSTLMYILIVLIVGIIPFMTYLNSPVYKYNQYNEQQYSSLVWIKENTNSEDTFYSDLKMDGAIASFADRGKVYHSPVEEYGWMTLETIPVFYGNNTEKALDALRRYNPQYIIFTKDMTDLTIQASNEMLKPTNEEALNKYDKTEHLDKIYNNNYVWIYKSDFNA